MDKGARDREEKALRFTTFCVRRLRTEQTEERIAAGLGFRSPNALYLQLELDGSPVCGTCGLIYPDLDHRDEHEAKNKRRKRRPGVGGGHRIELPDASDAASLFRQTLEALDEFIAFVYVEESWLEGNVEEDGFKGKHFITRSVERDAREAARREEFTEEQWRELCERHGADPGSEQVVLSVGEATAGGVGRAPSHFLTALIAACVLADRPLTAPDRFKKPPPPPLMEVLVGALHPDPKSADMGKVYAKVNDLREAAGHLAARVRGGFVGSGKGIEEVSREEHFAAWLIRSLEEEGAPADEGTHERLKKKFPSLAEWLTPTEIDRIKRLRLEPPQ
ncbi:MAG: hypothetical protein M3R38_08635 [Actinomycetota bacterium]|nr:hypothetical protein [Actinomycetota bacterium]